MSIYIHIYVSEMSGIIRKCMKEYLNIKKIFIAAVQKRCPRNRKNQR